MSQGPRIFLSAAEASGDAHAAGLVRALRRQLPDAQFFGAAGPKMAAEGCEVLCDLTARASMLLGPVANLAYYRRMVRLLRQNIRQRRPDVVVPVDSPALNWHIAAEAKAQGIPVMYYIAPQVWAWAPWRIAKVRRLTDHVACILPFEQDYFRSREVSATFVGHPLFDAPANPSEEDPVVHYASAWREGTWRVALLPGSRPAEIRNHAAAFSEVGRAIRQQWPDTTLTFTAVDDAAADAIRRHAGTDIDITVGRTGEVLAGSDLALAASGTVTLDVARYGVPMVVVYRASRLAYHLLGRWLIRTRQLSLVNILAGREIVPELMPWFGRVETIREAVLALLREPGRLAAMSQHLRELTAPLAAGEGKHAADNAASLVVDLLDRQSRESSPTRAGV